LKQVFYGAGACGVLVVGVVCEEEGLRRRGQEHGRDRLLVGIAVACASGCLLLSLLSPEGAKRCRRGWGDSLLFMGITVSLLGFFVGFIGYLHEDPPGEEERGDYHVQLICIASMCAFLLGVVFEVYAARVVPVRQVHPPTAEFKANLLSYVTFSYLNDLIQLAMREESLENTHVPAFSDGDCCELMFNRGQFADLGPVELISKTLLKKLYSLISVDFHRQGFFQFISSSSTFLGPLALQRILLYMSSANGTDGGQSKSMPLFPFSANFAVAVLFIAPIARCFSDGQNYIRGRRIVVRVRATLISLLYKKSLVVDLTALAEGPSATSNLISVDVKEIEEFVCYAHFVWSCLLEVVIVMVLLYNVIGVSAFGGVGVMILSIPFNSVAFTFMSKFQEEQLGLKDERMGVLNEVLNGIRIIKVLID
jgi:ABC-type multidrug transport system fused ATPase/permease subunit